MPERVIFFNTGWMDFYQGISSNDKISGGGKYVQEMGFGHEIMNFEIFNGHLYGYVQPKINKDPSVPSIIAIDKLGASKTDDKVEGITVVWTARDPDNRGTYIVGWYRNATVYRHLQLASGDPNRRYNNETLGYYAKVNVENAKLLTKDERNFRVRRGEKNWMGQSNVWFAENNPAFVEQVKHYIANGSVSIHVENKSTGKGAAKQSDPMRRIAVEKKAVQVVTKHYEKLGYTVDSFEKDNVGWDLTATNEKTELKLEVKGLSGVEISTELTPNEYLNLKADTKFYRVCIVTNTLTDPVLKVFAYSMDNNRWTSEDGSLLQFKDVVSAKIFV
jgi:hypothetical protein